MTELLTSYADAAWSLRWVLLAVVALPVIAVAAACTSEVSR